MSEVSLISDEDWQLFCQYSTSLYNKNSCKPKSQKNLNLLLHNVNWSDISKHFLLSEDFMYRYADYLDWELIFQHQIISDEFLRNNLSKLYRNRGVVSRYQHLSENMMRELDYLLDWSILSKYQTMSETFIEENREKVNWENIKEHQKLSPEFKEKYFSTQLD